MLKRIWLAPLGSDHKMIMAIVNIGIVASAVAFVIGLSIAF